MKLFKTTALAAVVAGSLGLAGAAIAQDKTYTIGVSVPTADHGWTGGVNFFAQQAVDRLSQGLSEPQVRARHGARLDQAGRRPRRHGDDPQHRRAWSSCPAIPDAMTASIKKVKDAGKWVTVVDRALSQPGIEDLYVAGDNPGLGATTAAYFKQALPDGGKIVILRGLPIPIDKQRFDAFMAGIEGTKHQGARQPVRQLEPR